jgi:hypothetical protein
MCILLRNNGETTVVGRNYNYRSYRKIANVAVRYKKLGFGDVVIKQH